MISVEKYNEMQLRCNDLEAENRRLKNIPSKIGELSDALDAANKKINSYEKRHSKSERKSSSTVQRKDAEKIIVFVNDELGIPLSVLSSRDRNTKTAFARSVLIYFLYHGAGYTSTKIGTMLNREHSSILYGLRLIERDFRNKDRRVCDLINKFNSL